jgi:glycogen operon protein
VRSVIRLQVEQPVLRRRKFFQGRPIRGAGIKDLTWLEPSGQEMTDDAWNAGFVRALGMLLFGDSIDETDERGERIVGDTRLLLLNAHDGPIAFTLPTRQPGEHWELVLDTARSQADSTNFADGAQYELQGRSLVLMRLPPLAK